MDRFERGAKGKTEAAQDVVKGGDDEASSADLRREAAIAAKNQAGEEQPAGDPPIVVDVPPPGGGDGPGVVTEYQSIAPEEGTSPPLVVPPDDDDQDEDDDPDAASDFKAGPNPASPILPEVQAVSGLPISRERLDVFDLKSDELDHGTSIPPVQDVIDYPDFLDVQLKADVNSDPDQSNTGDDAGLTQLDGDPDRPILPGVSAGIEVNTITDTTGAMGGTLNSARQEGTVESSRQLDDDATTTNVMPGDNVTVVWPDQRVISGDYDNMQTGAEAAGLDGTPSVNAAWHNDAFDLDLRDDPGVSRLVGNELVFAREEPDIGHNAAQTIGGDPDRPIEMENPTGNLTPSEQRKWDVWSNTAEPQPIEPPVTSFTGFGSYEAKTQAAGDAPGEAMIDDRPLEFIIGDMMPGNGATSSENATDDTSMNQVDDLPVEPILGQYPTGNFAEQSTANADQPLEFKATSGIDDERVVDEMTTLGEHNDVALGGPDTSSRLVGLPEVPHVADGSQVPGEVDTTMHFLETMEGIGDTLVDPAAAPLELNTADSTSDVSVEPVSGDQPDTTMSSLDEDDDDPFDGM